MALTPRHVFRYFKTDGVPSSGKHNPVKAEIIQLLEQLFGVSRGGWVVAQTRAALLSVTPEDENDGGVVLDDPNPAYNGYYSRVAGVWDFGRGFPDTFALVTLTGSGTAQTGTVKTGVSAASVEVFFAEVTTPNTGPLKLTIGGVQRDVLNAAGNPLSPGEWTGGVMFRINPAGKFQLINDAGAAASAAQSATFADQRANEAEGFANEAASVIIGNEFPVSYQAQPLSSAQQAQARENIHALPEGLEFSTTVEVESGNAAWELTTVPVGAAKDALLIHHTLDAPSNGVHVLATVEDGISGGQAGGFAMNGPGTANAIVGNRYQDGGGHGVEGNRVGSGNGYGVHAICSSTGGAVRALSALKQNDTGVPSGTAGVGPAVEISNISNEGMALQTSTSVNNVSAISNEFSRGNGAGGIIADFKISDPTTRTSAAIGQRIAIAPSASWAGSHAVIGQEVNIGANATGSVETRGLSILNYSVGNTTSYGIFASAYGANTTNYGGYFQAGGGENNYALRADGNALFNNDVSVFGTLSKAAGTFLIDHPLDPENKRLAHGFVEAPRYDLIYRGTAKLKRGKAGIDIDAASDMTGGTFAALTCNAVVTSLQNQDGFARLRPGEITGGTFEIICEDDACTDTVSWVVIAERNDAFVRSASDPNTDAEGRFIPERLKEK